MEEVYERRLEMENIGHLKYPVQFVQTLRGGTAHVILFSDGKKYVVKWNGSEKDRAKEVVNEYVVSKLAGHLSLPVVPFELVYIPDEFIMQTPELHSKKYIFRSGTHIGCLFIENSLDFKTVLGAFPSVGEVKNSDMLAGMIVFDHWVYNIDRTKSNLLLERLSEGNYHVHMIDQGKCFPGGYNWNAKTLSQTQKDKFNYQVTYQWAFSLLTQEDILSFINKIYYFSNELIYEVIQSIPEDWEVSNEERQALYNYLVEYKNHLPNIMTNFIDKYQNNRWDKNDKAKMKKIEKQEKKRKK